MKKPPRRATKEIPACIRFKKDEYEKLRQLSFKRNVTISELVRQAVQERYFGRA